MYGNNSNSAVNSDGGAKSGSRPGPDSGHDTDTDAVDINLLEDKDIVVLVPKQKEVFAILITRYEKVLLRYIQRLGAYSYDDRIDILQNVFIKAYRNIQSYDSHFAFSTWLYRIAHNETISFFRAKKIRPEGNLIDDSEEVLARIRDDGDGSDTAELANQALNASELNKALLKLDDKYRDVLILRFFEERDYGEISDILQIPSGSVATLIHRAKKKLAEYLAHLKEEDEPSVEKRVEVHARGPGDDGTQLPSQNGRIQKVKNISK